MPRAVPSEVHNPVCRSIAPSNRTRPPRTVMLVGKSPCGPVPADANSNVPLPVPSVAQRPLSLSASSALEKNNVWEHGGTFFLTWVVIVRVPGESVTLRPRSRHKLSVLVKGPPNREQRRKLLQDILCLSANRGLPTDLKADALFRRLGARGVKRPPTICQDRPCALSYRRVRAAPGTFRSCTIRAATRDRAGGFIAIRYRCESASYGSSGAGSLLSASEFAGSTHLRDRRARAATVRSRSSRRWARLPILAAAPVASRSPTAQIQAYDDDHVAFAWKDYRNAGAVRTVRLTPNEFIRRFFLHVLPDGFHRIRHFGFLADGRRTKARPLLLTPDEQGRVCSDCGEGGVRLRRSRHRSFTAIDISWLLANYRTYGNSISSPHERRVFKSDLLAAWPWTDLPFMPKTALMALFYHAYWAFRPSHDAVELNMRDPRIMLSCIRAIIILLVCAPPRPQ